jgi:hypothetical protein
MPEVTACLMRFALVPSTILPIVHSIVILCVFAAAVYVFILAAAIESLFALSCKTLN